MIVKLLVLALAAGALWIWMRRPAASGGTRRVSRDLVQCKTCGIYLPADEPCRCKDHG